jgi:hypothetical protein
MVRLSSREIRDYAGPVRSGIFYGRIFAVGEKNDTFCIPLWNVERMKPAWEKS